MSDTPDEERLEELRRQKLQELQEGGGEGAANAEAQEDAQRQADAQKQAILRQYLTDDARKRLNSVRMSKPEFADQVEQQLVALAQSGRLGQQIDDERMKELLRELKPDSQSYNIRRR